MPIQILLDFDRFDLGQDECDALVVTRDRHCFTATSILPVDQGHDDNACFSATAPRNAKRLFEWPNFFSGFDLHSSLRNAGNQESNSEFQPSIAVSVFPQFLSDLLQIFVEPG